MKKMKNLILTFLVAALMMPVLNAEGESTLTKLNVDGKDILSSCNKNTENTNGNEFVCNVEIEWNTNKVTVEATPDADSQITTDSENDYKDGVDTPYPNTSFQVVLEKTVDGNKVYTIYTVNVAKKEAPTPKLNSLKVTVDGNELTLSPAFDAEETNYDVELPYNATKVMIAAEADKDFTVDGDGEFEIPLNTTYTFKQICVTLKDTNFPVCYTISFGRQENPIVEEVREKLEDKGLNVEFNMYGNEAEFSYITILDGGNSTKVDMYYTSIDEKATSDDIVAIIEKAIKEKPLYSMIINTSDDNVLTEDMIKAIKDSAYQVMVSGYQAAWIFDGSKLTNDFKGMKLDVKVGEEVEESLKTKILDLVENKEKSLVIDILHNGKLPAGTKVRVGVDKEMFGEEKLTLYLYNTESGKLNVVTKNLKIMSDDMIGDYVEFELDHASSYVLTTASNNAQTGVLNVVLYTVLAIGSLAGILFLLKKKAN